MAQGYDGEVIIDTELKTDGIARGSKELEQSLKRMASGLKGLSDQQKSSLQSLLASFNLANRAYSEQAKAVDALRKKQEQLNNMPGTNKAMDSIAAQMDKLEQKYNELIAKQKQLRSDLISPDIAKVSSPERQQEMLNRSPAYTELQNQINQTTAAMDRLNAEYQRQESLYKADLEQKKAANLQDLARAQDQLARRTRTVDDAYDRATQTIKEYSEAVKKSANESKRATAGMRGVHKGLGRVGRSANYAGMSFGNMLAQSLLFSVVFRVFSAIMASMGDSLNALALQSSSTNAALSSLQSSLQYLSASVVAAFSPILEYVAPVLSTLIDLLAQAVAWIGQFFAALTGKGTYVKAVKVQKDYAAGLANTGKAAKGAGKDAKAAAKDAELATLSFDELNQLDTGSGSGGSGGSGGGTGGGGAGGGGGSGVEFVTEEISKDMQELSQDMEAFGERIGNALIKALQSIDWDEVYQTAENFGRGLAEFLNGLISPELFGELGRAIANSLNTALHFLNSFGETFDFEDFGKSIATGINEFFGNFDFRLLAKTLNTWVDGLEDFIAGFIKEIDLQKIFDGLGSFWSEIEIDTLTFLIGAILLRPRRGGTLLSLLIENIKASIASITTSGIPISQVVFTIGNFLINAPSFVMAADDLLFKLEEYIREHGGQKIMDALGDCLLIAVGAGVGFAFAGPAGAIAGGLIGLIADAFVGNGLGKKILTAIKDNVFNWDFTNQLLADAKESFANAFNADNFIEFGQNIILGLIQGLLAAFAFIVEPIKDLLDWIVENICSIFGIQSQGGNAPAEQMMPYGRDILEGIAQGFRNAFGEMIKALTELKNEIVEWWGKTQSYLVSKWNELREEAVEKFTAIKEYIALRWSEIKQNTEEIWTALKAKLSEWLEGIKTNISTALDNIKTTWSTIWNGVKETTESIFSGIWNFIRNTINNILSGVERMANGVVDGINKMINALNSLSFDIPDWVPEIGGNSFGLHIPTIGHVSLPRLASGTVVPPQAGEFAAVLGDNNRETEVVSPLSTMRQALTEALAEAGVTGTQNIVLRFEGNLAQLARILKPAIDSENKRVGVKLVTGGI